MTLIDTHCHLFMDPLSRDVEGALARAGNAGVKHMVVPAYDLDSWGTIRDLGGHEGVHAALGLHPRAAHQVATPDAPIDNATARVRPPTESGHMEPNLGLRAMALEPLTLAQFKDCLAAELEGSGAVAIGEIGLDFSSGRPTPAEQVAVLKCQLDLAVDLDLPVSLHCFNGWEILFGALQPLIGRIRGVLHGYTRHPELAGPVLKCGFYVSFGGDITRPEAKRAHRSAEALAMDRIVLESDAPVTGLDGVDPDQTEPHHVQNVAQKLAEIRNIPVEEIAEITTNNARELFKI